jgi:hypothetical protein
MNHAEAVELIEIAAAEPDGLERLAAGDTPEAAALVGHVAGCADCATEFETLRRVAAAARETLADEPSPALRDRTLDYVAALGRERAGGDAADAPRARPAERAAASSGSPPAPGTSSVPSTGQRWTRPSWIALAAAVLVAAVAGGLIVGSVQRLSFESETSSLYSLARVNEDALRIGAEPDAVTVALAGPPGAATLGSLVFSGTSGEIAVVASGLPEPQDGWEYRCWVETASSREVIGKMTLAEGLAYWAGPSDGLGDAGPGTTFGVSLVEGGAASAGEPVLLGQVEGGES